MSNGEISENTASSYGGGVYVSSGTFTMSGGTLSGNNGGSRGGGVYVGSSGTFTKESGGTIYGMDASDSLKNTATYGYAAYVSSGERRNSTAGEGVTLDSSVSSEAGGWESAGTLQISLPVSSDPTLADAAIWVGQSTQFSAGSGYSTYTWYWNGTVISGANSDSYTLPANTKQTGVYELSVFVTTSAGEIFSARCQVTITQ